ncbi:MAG: DUF1009 domain-containing protein [Proteobacteria bacterium]|nr:MAG: DUF1009 domain-containing protein [Pseudomonadota bacterium]
MMAPAADGTPVGLIAGGGSLPFTVADQLAAQGRKPVVFALRGFCDPKQVSRFTHHWVSIGQFGAAKRLLRAEGCRDLVFIGSLVRPALSELRLDLGTLRVMPSVIRAYRGGDDHLLSRVGRIFEAHGFRVLGIRDVAPELLMPEGAMTRHRPDARAEADIVRGRAVLAALSPFDVGQAVVVIDGHVVAVEGIEGTDAMLARVAQLRRDRVVRADVGRGVLVKAAKRGQDLRFDLPTVGPRTVREAEAAGLAGLAIVAGNALVAEAQEMVEAADKAGLFVVGLSA